MLGTEVSKYRKTGQVKATMVDLPAGPLASLPGAPLAAFQPETAWTPPGHVMPAPAAPRSISVHADWHVVLQQTMILMRCLHSHKPWWQSQDNVCFRAVVARHVLQKNGIASGFGLLVLTQREKKTERQSSVSGDNKAMASMRKMHELSEATKAAKSSACCKWDLNTHHEHV